MYAYKTCDTLIIGEVNYRKFIILSQMRAFIVQVAKSLQEKCFYFINKFFSSKWGVKCAILIFLFILKLLFITLILSTFFITTTNNTRVTSSEVAKTKILLQYGTNKRWFHNFIKFILSFGFYFCKPVYGAVANLNIHVLLL